MALTVIVAWLLPCATADSAPTLYIADGYSVYSVPADGSATATVITTEDWSLAVRAIVLDPASDRLFGTTASNRSVFVSSLVPGSIPSKLPIPDALLANPSGLSIDPATGTLYWGTEGTGSNNGMLGRGPVAGGGAEIATPGFASKRPWGVAYAADTGLLWWTQYATPSSAIRWSRPDGSASGTLDTTGATVQNPQSIAISRARQRVYWGNQDGISSASLNGGDGSDIISIPMLYPKGLVIDDAAGRIRWFTDVAGSTVLHSANLDGTDIVDVPVNGITATSLGGALALLLDPVAGSAPAVSGTAALGQTLTCERDVWLTDLPEASVYRAVRTATVQWVRDGSVIAGATTSTLVPDVAGSYACRVIGANAAGSTVVDSAAISVPAADVVKPRVLSARWTVRGGSVRSTFIAPAGSNRFAITAARANKRDLRGHCRVRTAARKRTVACSISLTKGRWTVMISASKSSLVLARSTRTITIARG